MSNHDQDQLLKHIREALDQSVSAIDADTRFRLDDIRRQALQQQRVSEPVNDSEENLLMAARAGLDDSVADLDPDIVASLDRARKSALEQNDPSESAAGFRQTLAALFRLPPVTAPVGAFATACVLVTMVGLFYQLPLQGGSDLADADVLLFASGDEIELYGNLEFYLWLADNGLPN
jgi:hypothetical protein